MRINVYTEELLNIVSNPPMAELVWAEYISSRTGEKVRNYGVRIFVKSHPDLHYIPDRDDDRSAVTFWCGPKEKNCLKFLDEVRQLIHEGTLKVWRDKTEQVQKEAEAAIGSETWKSS